MTERGRLTLRHLGTDNVDDFRALLMSPPHGWCWCVAWEVPTWTGWADRTEEQNRTLREALWTRGEFHARLFYLDGEPIAWCRIGPRATWPKLCETFRLDPAEPVHAFTCFGIKEEHRGRGWMHEAMRLTLDDLARQGVKSVEGFPRKLSGAALLSEVWMGPLGLFRRAVFVKVGESETSIHMMKKL